MKLCFILALICLWNAEPMSGEKLVESINKFSLDFYKNASKLTPDKNVFSSGNSLSTVLSMLLSGARSRTATEIKNTLGYQGLTEQQVETEYHNLLTKVNNHNKAYQLDVANSLWIKQGFKVLTEFKNTVEKKYYSEVQEVPFGTKAATDKINNWVNKKTNGKVTKLFDSTLADSTRLALVNALSFKGYWKERFNQNNTKKEPFYPGNSSNHKLIDMMNIVSSFRYGENNDLNAQLLELPYHGGDVNMIIVLPKTRNGLANLETKVTLSNLETALNTTHSTKVHVNFPKFKTSSTFDLISILESMGIKDAFGSKADFSGIDGKRDLYVSKGIQKTALEVNEDGTVAAAASGIVIGVTSSLNPKPIYFTADHPFLFIIRHIPTGVFLFVGRFSNP